MCKSTKCQSKCKVPCSTPPDVLDIRKGMLSQGPTKGHTIRTGKIDLPADHTWPTIKVTTIDLQLDKDVETFFKWMGNAPTMTLEQFLEGTTPMTEETAALLEQDLKETRGYDELPPYYDNSKGSLYHIAEQRGWGVRLFDLVKRLERGGKKDPLKQELEKSIGVLQLWLKELEG